MTPRLFSRDHVCRSGILSLIATLKVEYTLPL